jgi:hypothetical protein
VIANRSTFFHDKICLIDFEGAVEFETAVAVGSASLLPPFTENNLGRRPGT